MTDKDIKLAIQSAIKDFSKGTLTEKARHLFETLGYDTERQNPLDQKTFAGFEESFLEGDVRFRAEKALVKEWNSVDLLFQLTKAEVSDGKSLFETKQVDQTIIETYLFFAIELTEPEYTRTALAQITREINKIFPMPVMLLFKHGEHLTLSVINRRLHKKDERKDVLEKVTLIKDISTRAPHRAHLDILFDLSLPELKRVHKCANFVELHNAWQQTLDTKELNKRFYRELSNWYFWALSQVAFPNDLDDEKDDTVFNAESIIRLLTRLIFIWFIKEKHLIPEQIFAEKDVSTMIKGFKTKGSTVYYRAILQNLFFATLNQKIEERAFATDGTFEQNKKNYGIKNLYRYAADFAISQADVLTLFERVPFLNGGLFDCLDSEDQNGKVMYLDGFSRNPNKQARVPDELFFAQEKTIDLSAVYDDHKKKNETVKGLFEIFNQYKFTVTENTPIEEEVALDPELLGRVFENLLASYNPETKTTARKQTGSFYTPREIVNYMVDESLKAYLKHALETDAAMPPEDAETGLKLLLGYNEKEHLFDEPQMMVLIHAIDNAKILDPACGSGAFPMGILHKLVHLLHKLDPQNIRWKERQIEKVDHLIQDAGHINDPAISEKIMADLEANKHDIEEAFANNELDYGRKLYLIENCIYGVDIQTIATQISKLRFFISLIVDQKPDQAKENFGIRPLPNLETKFVAANTLISIEKSKQQLSLLDNQNVKKLEETLKDVRHRLFSAKTPVAKRKLRAEDQSLREEIAQLLIRNGWGNETARQLAGWNPYNQNASSPFFDPEWMFGMQEGFDIVLGNPPYLIVKEKNTEKNILKEYFKYYSADFKVNLFALFIEKSIKIGKPKSIHSYIIPDSSLNLPAFKKLREFILNSGHIEHISYFEETIFESADVGKSIILEINRSQAKDFFHFRHFHSLEDREDTKIENSIIKKDRELKFVYKSSNSSEYLLLEKLKNIETTLNFYCDIYDGINPGSEELKNTFITRNRIDSYSQKIIDGKNFNKYSLINWGGDYIYYNEEFVEQVRERLKKRGESFTARIIKKVNFFEHPKIVTRQTAETIIGTIDTQQFYVKNSVHSSLIKPQFKDRVEMKVLLGILNSKLIDWYYRYESLESGRLFPQVKIERLRTLPIIYPQVHASFKSVIEQIFAAKQRDPAADTRALEAELDRLVYALYGLTDEEIAIVEGKL